jgi:sorbitol-specific phosphotransferase system component IIBC
VLTTISGQWVVGSVAMAAWGVAYMGVVLNTVNYRQQVTPEPLMSRVNTTGRMLSFGVGWPLGSILGGVVAEAAGPRAGMLAGTAVLVLGCGYAWLSPLRGQGPLPSETGASTA